MTYFKFENKNIYYKEVGKGKPVIFLHGNTASSKMFNMVLSVYKKNFKVILIDFLGNGKSDRVKEIPTDIWIWQAKQVVELIKHLGIGKVSLVGTSGGAFTAINVALLEPNLIERVVADSFEGRKLKDGFSDYILRERESAKNSFFARKYYEYNQGKDWKKVVDLDTKALVKLYENKRKLFVKPIENLQIPVLFTISLEDEMLSKNTTKKFEELKQILENVQVHYFEKGGHPAILSNAKECANIITEFLVK
ncbi:alpha/beta fold hydrolase [Miniphocaeibacter massiliensis]|uniref:alpha/beta fold hydrolase n=1 Tax=Miniphocaeibacter massiliensis TaxID=2041841 RepID=UPI000C07F54C|nr:alpha/beta hydrolase [Miniphocaeibacter massiliensis]